MRDLFGRVSRLQLVIDRWLLSSGYAFEIETSRQVQIVASHVQPLDVDSV